MADTTIRIEVVRSGGIAGIRRTWNASPPPAAAEQWSRLIDSCPWESAPDDTSSRDRYVWLISAVIADTVREAAVPERHLTGPWRTLVEQVRKAADAGSTMDSAANGTAQRQSPPPTASEDAASEGDSSAPDSGADSR
ncbi:protealysin inhibitor emfourin [Humidisolicoccus flavus]|uniref:protealysin inhibitor emfourin n=1 Tax=Humidisolicoccus flavus TaxID=3111414 RepID=UPI00324D6ACD